jgi:hypothetical protein
LGAGRGRIVIAGRPASKLRLKCDDAPNLVQARPPRHTGDADSLSYTSGPAVSVVQRQQLTKQAQFFRQHSQQIPTIAALAMQLPGVQR